MQKELLITKIQNATGVSLEKAEELATTHKDFHKALTYHFYEGDFRITVKRLRIIAADLKNEIGASKIIKNTKNNE
jgi:hypothetical protein